MKYPKRLLIPVDAGELIFGNISYEEPRAYWHLMSSEGCGEHTFCSMAFDEIEILNSHSGIKDKNKRGGFCTCPECIRTIVELKKKLAKIKISGLE